VEACALCMRKLEGLTDHHLIPQTRHKNKWNKKTFDRQEVHDLKIRVCQPCHSKIHSVFSEKDLEREYNTLESLKNHPEIQKFVRWVSKRYVEKISSKKMRD